MSTTDGRETNGTARSHRQTTGLCGSPINANDQSNHDKSSDLCFFAGVGFDSLMLNDFKAIKAWSKRTVFFKGVLSSVTGYCIALVVKTLPKCILWGSRNVHVKLTTRSPTMTLFFVDYHRGGFVRPTTQKLTPVRGPNGDSGRRHVTLLWQWATAVSVCTHDA